MQNNEAISQQPLPDTTPVGYIHAVAVQGILARVLGTALTLSDASMPNKDQCRAFKHLVRKAFDDATMEINVNAYRQQFAPPPSGEYALEPIS